MTNRNTLSQLDNAQLYPMHYKYSKLAYKRSQICIKHLAIKSQITN